MVGASGGGRVRLQLEEAVQQYAYKSTEYGRKLKQWRDFGQVGQVPTFPEVPEYLSLWFELQRWPGNLLVAGGLMDQPHWVWELVNLAGTTYSDSVIQPKPGVGDNE